MDSTSIVEIERGSIELKKNMGMINLPYRRFKFRSDITLLLQLLLDRNSKKNVRDSHYVIDQFVIFHLSNLDPIAIVETE